MKKIILTISGIVFFTIGTFAQTQVTMQAKYRNDTNHVVVFLEKTASRSDTNRTKVIMSMQKAGNSVQVTEPVNFPPVDKPEAIVPEKKQAMKSKKD
jgi:hypothetical protein